MTSYRRRDAKYDIAVKNSNVRPAVERFRVPRIFTVVHLQRKKAKFYTSGEGTVYLGFFMPSPAFFQILNLKVCSAFVDIRIFTA